MTDIFHRVPVEPAVLMGHFVGEDNTELTLNEYADLAEQINETVEHDRQTLWINPEKDSKELTLHGRPLKIGKRCIRSVGGEMAFFPKLLP